MNGATFVKYSLIGLVVLAGIALALAQGKSDAARAYQNLTDAQLMQEAVNFSSFQIIMGELAVKQAAGREFKDYGKDMTAAHGQIYRDLEKIASGKGIKLAPDIDPVRQNTVRYYSQEYGAAFDRSYISLMVDENRRDAELYRYMAQKAGGKDLREFAGRVAPNLEGYAKRAEKILADLPFPFLK
jgi:putative membrane protein